MVKKCLVFFYYFGANNEAIADSDWKESYVNIANHSSWYEGIDIKQPEYCKTAAVISGRLQEYTAQYDEIYLHLSGHGNSQGIPFDDWLLRDNDLVNLIQTPKLKFCFFSSCESVSLVKLLKGMNIPVVVGTAGNNEIENSYAIAFQVAFYTQLLQAQTFADAFNIAISAANVARTKMYSGSIITLRGEGGQEVVNDARINALQIAFATTEDEQQRMIPANILQKIRAAHDMAMGSGESEMQLRPVCLNWFASDAASRVFGNAFEAEGYSEICNYFEVEDEDLKYLSGAIKKVRQLKENPAAMIDMDTDYAEITPLIESKINLVFHCGDMKLSDDAQEHLLNLKEYGDGLEKHSGASLAYQTFFCTKTGIAMSTLVDNTAVLPDTEGCVFTFENQPGELVKGAHPFIQAIDMHELPPADRKNTTLRFKPESALTDAIDAYEVSKYVQLYFVHSQNEKLVRFLIQRLRAKEKLKTRVEFIDNQPNPKIDFVTAFTEIINKMVGDDADRYRFEFNLPRIYDEGLFLLVHDRSDNINKSTEALKNILLKLERATDARMSVDAPVFLFFLSKYADQISLNSDKEVVRIMQYVKPRPVTETVVDSWVNICKEFYPRRVTTYVVDISYTIKQNILEDKFSKCCPSAVVGSICTSYRLPMRQIFG